MSLSSFFGPAEQKRMTNTSVSWTILVLWHTVVQLRWCPCLAKPRYVNRFGTKTGQLPQRLPQFSLPLSSSQTLIINIISAFKGCWWNSSAVTSQYERHVQIKGKLSRISTLPPFIHVGDMCVKNTCGSHPLCLGGTATKSVVLLLRLR